VLNFSSKGQRSGSCQKPPENDAYLTYMFTFSAGPAALVPTAH